MYINGIVLKVLRNGKSRLNKLSNINKYVDDIKSQSTTSIVSCIGFPNESDRTYLSYMVLDKVDSNHNLTFASKLKVLQPTKEARHAAISPMIHLISTLCTMDNLWMLTLISYKQNTAESRANYIDTKSTQPYSTALISCSVIRMKNVETRNYRCHGIRIW